MTDKTQLAEHQCPRCGGDVPNAEHKGQYPGALSRWDNQTYVCSACGQDEALSQYAAHLAGDDPGEAVHPLHGVQPWAYPPAGYVV
jgi:hypothetical protein